MLRSYLATALRCLAGQKLHSAINVAGLAMGLGSFVLIGLFVRHELGYDGFWANADRIYRISRDYYAVDGAPNRVPASTNAPVAAALLEDFSEIEQTARVFGGRTLLQRDAMAYYENGFRWADGTLFEIFDLEWLVGDPATALAQPQSIVLTARLATKYFGTEEPLGQTLVFNNSVPLSVTGVVADLPQNTHLSFDALASLNTLPALFGARMLEQWNASTDYHTYFLLRKDASVAAIETRMADFVDRHIAPDASAGSGMTIMNVRDIHNRSTRDEEWKPAGNLSTVYGFTAIALLILAIACINFMNLATARSAKRAKEVGIRKSLGASRRQIIGQFLGESVLTAVLAMLVAAVAVELLLPSYSAFIGTPLQLRYFGADGVAPLLAGVTVLVGLVAGSYPALYLSAFAPEKVLKGDFVHGRGGATFRNALVIAQFAIAIALLIGTAVIHQQTSFARNLDLGFNKEQIVVLTGSRLTGLGPQWQAMKQQLLTSPEISSVTASHYTPFSWDDNRWTVRPQGASSISRIQYMAVDYDFFETYEIDVVAGRSFSRDFGADALGGPTAENAEVTGRFIVNESAARLIGWSAAEAVGQTLELALDPAFGVSLPMPIVGVVRDTYFESVALPVRPMIYVLTPEPVPSVRRLEAASIRVADRNLPATLAFIDATWREFVPDQPVTRHFLDQDFEALYHSQERQAEMFTYFSSLAVAVACLGLLGLAWFATERRTKEIGIRKVVGGSVWDVVRLFTGEFSKLVLAANLVAWPAAYFLVQRWLTGFAYRIDLGLLPFVGGALLALLVAGVTVGAVAARAASAKPIKALRYE
jgi:putative ABC transport system permease protein